MAFGWDHLKEQISCRELELFFWGEKLYKSVSFCWFNSIALSIVVD